jgi:hypothetical protein
VPAQLLDRRIVRIQQPPLGEKRVRERVGDRAFHGLPELRTWHEQRVNVHPVGVQGDVTGLHLLVVNGDEHEVDVGLCPDGVMRQTAAEDRGQDRAILFDLFDEVVERCGMNCSAHGLTG